MSSPETPTMDEIRRVARYWQHVKDMACKHPTITFSAFGEPRCGGDCGRPIVYLSDLQLEEAKRRAGGAVESEANE